MRQSVFGAIHDGGVHVAHHLFGGTVHDIRLHDEPAVGSAVIAGNGYRVVYNQLVSHYFPGYGAGLRIRVLSHDFHFLKGDAAVDVGINLLLVVYLAQFVLHLHVKDERAVFRHAYFVVPVGACHGVGIEEQCPATAGFERFQSIARGGYGVESEDTHGFAHGERPRFLFAFGQVQHFAGYDGDLLRHD